MSASLFKSRQFLSKKNLKKLTILAPLENAPSASATTTPVSATAQIVVLVVKYSFKAESAAELSVAAKDYVKLLSRPGNGWLEVQHLDKFDTSGLIPASYVDIEVNDLLNPISIEWLNEYAQNSALVPQELLKAAQTTDLCAPNLNHGIPKFEKAYPRSATVANVLQNSDSRFWYRIDFKMSDNTTIYVAKFYQDFYNMHINLAALQNDSSACQLPKLPQPIRTPGSFSTKGSPTSVNFSQNPPVDSAYVEALVTRSNQLNVYLNKLVRIELYQKSTEMDDFVNSNDKTVIVNCGDCVPDHEINDRLYFNSTNVMDMAYSPRKPKLSVNTSAAKSPPSPATATFSPTAPLPPIKPNFSMSTSKSTSDLSKYSNIKYSTYMSQTTTQDASPKQAMPESTSSTTISSFGSLIDGYDDDKEENSDFSGNGTDTSVSEADILESSHKAPISHKSSILTIDSTKKHHFSQSSEPDSVFSANTSATHRTHVNQPSTPVFNGCFEDHSVPSTPTSPIFEDDESVHFNDATPSPFGKRNGSGSSAVCSDFIKIKIALDNCEDDIVALKIKNTNLISIVYLKKLLSHKIYKDCNLIDHYNLRVLTKGNDTPTNAHMTEGELLSYIKCRSKVNLKLVRARG